MVSYQPQNEKIKIDKSLMDVNEAENMISEIKYAIEIAKYHKQQNDEVKYNSLALEHLRDPVDREYELLVDISLDPSGNVDKKYIKQTKKDQVLSEEMRIIKGDVNAHNIQKLHQSCTSLVSFTVTRKS